MVKLIQIFDGWLCEESHSFPSRILQIDIQIYFADQSQFPVADEAELKAMDKRIADLTAESAGLHKEVSKLEAELTTVSNELTLEDAKARLAEVNADIATGEE